LIAALGRSVPDGAGLKQIEALVEQLGDKSYAVRQKAVAALKQQGLKAAAVLNRAAATADLERRRRIETCLKHLDHEMDLAGAAVRLIGARKPTGAIQALLDFLPWTPSDGLAREAEDALAALAVTDKASPALHAALKSDHARVRKAAAAALGQTKGLADEPGRRVYPEGLRLPRRILIFQNRDKLAEIDVVATEFFNRFDDALFERPKENDRRK
jgi:HEAT repeat protein